MTSPIKVRVQLEGTLARFTWVDPEFYYEDLVYQVDFRDLKKMAKRVRLRLQKLVNRVTEGETRVGPELKSLADSGAKLRQLIFRGVGEPSLQKASVTRDKFLPQRAGHMLVFIVDPQIYIPWGLAYEGDLDKLDEDPEDPIPDLYEGFWCNKWQLSTLYNVINASGLEEPRTFEEARMLTVVNDDVWSNAKTALPDEERPLFEQIWNGNGQEPAKNHFVKNPDDFFTKWAETHRELDLLYLYCHASGEDLALSNKKSDHIELLDFKLSIRYPQPQYRPLCLVFLNGCQTAVGAEGGGFLDATGQVGFCGFIGTEAKVPDLFAMRFAMDFFCRLLYEGKTVIEILRHLRRQHWPLSLIYSACCHPRYRIAHESGATKVPLAALDKTKDQSERNLSKTKVKVKKDL